MICLEIEKRRREQKTQTNPKPTPIQPKTPKPQAQPSTQPTPLLSLGRFNFLRGPVPHPARSPASAGLPPVAAQAPPLSLGPACATTRPQDPGPLAPRGPLAHSHLFRTAQVPAAHVRCVPPLRSGPARLQPRLRACPRPTPRRATHSRCAPGPTRQLRPLPRATAALVTPFFPAGYPTPGAHAKVAAAL